MSSKSQLRFLLLTLSFITLTTALSLPRSASPNWWNGGDGGYNPYGSSGGGGNDPGAFFNSGGSSSGGSRGPIFGPGGTFNQFFNINFRKMSLARIAHAALASSALVFFFPVGAICVRILPGKLAVFFHFVFQVFAYLIFVAAVGLGIWIARGTRFGSFNLLKQYHPIIGLVVFGLISLQPISGILHHLGFRRHGGRTAISYAHIWLGRAASTLGMINGGLGLRLAGNASRRQIIAYGVVAGIMWLIWMLVSLSAAVMRRRRPARVDGAMAGKGAQRDVSVSSAGGDHPGAHSTVPPTAAAAAVPVRGARDASVSDIGDETRLGNGRGGARSVSPLEEEKRAGAHP